MPETIHVRCCVAGGGPAGMMLGYLLARAGIEVAVLEKHADFLRDFRGDTVHPSTLQLLHELGLLDDFLKRPHQNAYRITGVIGETEIVIADFARLPTRCRFVAFVPQWEFLDFLAEAARRFPRFHLYMRANVTGLIDEAGRVVGVRAETPTGRLDVRADLVVGCDGRHSTVREAAGLPVRDLGAPIDALWMRLPRRPGDPHQPLGRFGRGQILVLLDRGDYWQCADVIPKSQFEVIRSRGLPAFHHDLNSIAPFLGDRVRELTDWDQIKLLTVRVDRLERWWRPGLLCIGDAAHAMSPIGGVGINLAIQDAVAAANRLVEPLFDGRVTAADLRAVQRRRELPTRLTQRMQILIQDRVIGRVLGAGGPVRPPLILRLVKRFSFLNRLPARAIGMGFRPEHVRTGEAYPGNGPTVGLGTPPALGDNAQVAPCHLRSPHGSAAAPLQPG